jgi:hypothetical protein
MKETFIPGRLMHATVNGAEAVVYLTLMLPDKGPQRRDHWYRFFPGHELVPFDADVVMLSEVNTHAPKVV